MIRKIHVAAAAVCALAISAALAAGPPPMSDSADIARIGVAPGIDRIEAAARSSAPPLCAPNSGVKVSTGATLCGLAGASGSNTFAYEGIQYATASRWIGPKAFPPPSSGTVNQTAFGPFCPQSVAGVAAGAEAEACLYLNVWAPATAINTSAKLPVMVFIHGGAFITGRGSAPTFDGSALAAKGAVVVTLNYRLGALGFLVSAQDGVSSSGNFGLMDQQAALNWVQSYISSFGGDNTNVTIFGESAGAMSVGLHTFDIPSSIGLFQKAVMESNPMAEQYHQPYTIAATAVGNQFLLYLCTIWSAEQKAGGNANPSCNASSNWQNSVSVNDIVSAQMGFLAQANSVAPSYSNAEVDIAAKYIGLRSLPWQPTVDGKFVVGEPYKGYGKYGSILSRKTMPPKPIMLGVNAQEGVLFAAGLNAALWNGGKMQQQRAATPTATTYNTLMQYTFSSPPGGSYLPSALQPTVFYSAQGTSLADIITDYAFICGNWFAANNAVGATGAKPLYAYYFSALPLFDPYYPDDLGACVNSICHGGELPFVFNTLAYGLSKSGSTGPVPAPDQALADAMTNAWFAFASTGNPGWTAYTAASSNATVFTASTTTIAPAGTIALGPKGQCSTVWNQYAPYN
jgi:para-nitrobenzyl esterase